MAKLAREIMTPAPQCCSGETLLNEVANLMVEADCGEIPVTDGSNRLIGVITDRDIVVRVVAQGKNPSAVTAAECMSEPVVVVNEDTTLADVISVMEKNQIRRVPVVDASGCCCGIISQADVAQSATENETGEMVKEVSKDSPGLTN
ncbi:MAG: CBS domain-containing protein [Vicinamibacterales bacterium]